MLLHFIFLVTREDLDNRSKEFQYIEQMSQFYKKWIHDTFSVDVDVQCDQLIVPKQSILQRLDTSTLLKDHKSRGADIFHFYLSNFRPLWTDCTCEGYYGENFALTLWKKPKTEEEFLMTCQTNCTLVSHELSHEFLRQKKFKKQVEIIHDVWSKHLFNDLPFEQYGKNFEPTKDDPYFLTIDATSYRS